MAALVIALSLVIARATITETLREPFGPTSSIDVRGAGPAAGLVLDLLNCVPALLVLLHRAIHPSQPRPRSWPGVFAGLLAVWMGLSVLWADDKFAAAVGAAHWISAMALFWAMARIATSWPLFRLVAALCLGLLLVCLAQAVFWRFVEMPLTRESFENNEAQFLHEMGWDANDFAARQFRLKVENMEMLGFNGSANSFAAVLVLLAGISAGLVIQRGVERDYAGAALVALPLPVAAWILHYTQSKAAFVTPFLVAAALLIVWKFGPALRRRARLSSAVGLSGVVFFLAVVLAYGLVKGGLPTASLNFRWRYWTAAWQMFLTRPLAGVGWNNFGAAYLRYRLPVAAEEIQDPHNFLLRFLTELGIIGAILSVAWLGRWWWEATVAEPSNRPARSEIFPMRAMRIIAIAAAGGIAVNCLAGIDLAQPAAAVAMEFLKRLLYFCVLMLGMAVAAMKSVQTPDLDDRPAPWVYAAVLASLAAFLIHNLIEFSLFEPGPMMLFAMLAGSVLGVRGGLNLTGTRRRAVIQFILAGAIWSVAALAFAGPVILAEGSAHDGDDQFRGRHYDAAAADYLRAFQTVPYNADYAYRAGLAVAYEPNRDNQAIKELLDQAIAANPSAVNYYLSRARIDGEQRDLAAMKADFSRALELNPNEVSIHLDYADALNALGQSADATEQDQLALKYNDLLQPDEPKRLSPQRVAEIHKQINP